MKSNDFASTRKGAKQATRMEFKEFKGKGMILQSTSFHRSPSAENKSGKSYVTEHIMVGVLFADSIKGAVGNVENSLKKPFQPVMSSTDISSNYRATFAADCSSAENSELWVSLAF